MTRTRSRHRATARSRFSESSQNPPSTASDSVISTTALTATRPARRRSRTASPIRNPSTPSPLVFHDPSAPERDRPSPEHPHEIGSVSGQHDGRAARPDVPEHVEDLGLHRLVEIPRRLVREEEWRFADDRPRARRAPSLVLRAPDCPVRTTNSPLVIRKETSLSAGTFTGPTEYTFQTRTTSIMAGMFDYSGPPQV